MALVIPTEEEYLIALKERKCPKLHALSKIRPSWKTLYQLLEMDSPLEPPHFIKVYPRIGRRRPKMPMGPKTFRQKIQNEVNTLIRGFNVRTRKFKAKVALNEGLLFKTQNALDEYFKTVASDWKRGDPPEIIRTQQSRLDLVAALITWRVRYEAKLRLALICSDRQVLNDIKRYGKEPNPDRSIKHLSEAIASLKQATTVVFTVNDLKTRASRSRR